jgi:hypothetical protein
MPSTLWHLDGRTAKLMLPQLSLAFEANRPGDGLRNIRVLDRHWPNGHLCGVTGPIQSAANCELAEWYVRGDDLIAVYETGQPDAARIDLHWHVAKPTERDSHIARIDLLVSIRTDRLDWRHNVWLESVIHVANEDKEFDHTCTWFAGAGGNWSLALMVHPADLRRVEVNEAKGVPGLQRVRHQLFRTESLEKGVILRARAAAVLFPLGSNEAATDDILAFAAADPPLGV